MIDDQFSWVKYYREFALILLTYKENLKPLIQNIIEVFEEIDINLPTLEKDNEIVDIDPFTIFGLFNKNSMKHSNRVKIVAGIAKKFDMNSAVPQSFDSTPVLNNQNAVFYYFIDNRSDEDIDDLWELFESAINYSNNQTQMNREIVSKYFDLVINKKGNGNSKVTMGLYWIAPHTFLNLDSRNKWYIYESGKIPSSISDSLPPIKDKIASRDYFDIVEKLKEYLDSPASDLKDFKELSFEAWTYSNQVNEEIKIEKEMKAKNEVEAGLADDDIESTLYWLYSPGADASKWDEFYDSGILAIGWGSLGDLSHYNNREEMREKLKELYGEEYSYKNDSLATWEFVAKMKPGDIIFVKKGVDMVIGRGVVTSEYMFESSRDDDYKNFRYVDWTHKGDWEHPGRAVTKSLTDITSYTNYVIKLENLVNDQFSDVESVDIERSYPPYGPEKFLEEVFMSDKEYDTLVGLLKTKKNVILQGAPGVGKTYAAKRLAYSIMGEKNQERVMMVQFHQSYSYEDFIEGFRPGTEGVNFEIKKGSFYNFCKKAADDLEKDYYFIIDEINRGNLSKIFGELFMLIENDKRGNTLRLLYSDELFAVPKNVHIIGMMNTADRSLAMLDYALRRRFAFYEMKPGFDTEGFTDYRLSLESSKFNSLIDCIGRLNKVILEDDSLGEGFRIGHSYFCNISTVSDGELSNIVNYEIIPLLKEYWFDEPIKVREWEESLKSSIK